MRMCYYVTLIAIQVVSLMHGFIVIMVDAAAVVVVVFVTWPDKKLLGINKNDDA